MDFVPVFATSRHFALSVTYAPKYYVDINQRSALIRISVVIQTVDNFGVKKLSPFTA